MALPDAAAEFARQLVTVLAGDAGRAERASDGDVRVLRREIAVEREARLRAERLLGDLRKAVKDVMDNDGDLLDESRRIRLARAYRWAELRDG